MLRLVLFIAFVSVALCDATVLSAQEELFSNYVRQYKKNYFGAEYKKRFDAFASNLETIEKLNKQHSKSSVKYGINAFTDLTPDEFRKQRLMNFSAKRFNAAMETLKAAPHVDKVELNDDLPENFNWTDKAVTPVKNQGSCGSCWAFSAIGNIEGQWALKGNNLTSLSPQQLVDCDHLDCGCLGGWPHAAMTYLKENGGLSTEQVYPYCAPPIGTCFSKVLNKTFCNPWSDYFNRTCLPGLPKTVPVKGFESVSTDEEVIKAYLFKHGPLSIGVNALWLQYYSGGISDPYFCPGEISDIDHAVLLVGYGVYHGLFGKEPYWVIKNSWGTDWGEQGYYRLYRGKGVCAVNKLVVNVLL